MLIRVEATESKVYADRADTLDVRIIVLQNGKDITDEVHFKMGKLKENAHPIENGIIAKAGTESKCYNGKYILNVTNHGTTETTTLNIKTTQKEYTTCTCGKCFKTDAEWGRHDKKKHCGEHHTITYYETNVAITG